MIVAAPMEAKFIDSFSVESGLQRSLKELAGGSVDQRQSIPGRGRRIEIPVRAAEPLVVVRNVKGVLGVQYSSDFSESRILVKASRKRARSRLNLRCQGRVRCQETGGQIIHCRSIVYCQRLVSHLAFIISQIKEAVVDDWSSHSSSKLLSPVVRFRDTVAFVDRIIRVGRGIQNVVVPIAVNVVGAALGYGVH